MKILIFGANSFLAAEIVKKFPSFNYSAYVHNNDYRLDRNKFSKIYYGMDELLRDDVNFDAIFLIGAHIPKDLNTISYDLIEGNVESILKVCKKFPESRIVFASSVAVYGAPSNVINESSVYNKPSYYGLSKLAGELIVSAHMRFSIVRFSAIWGKGMRENGYINSIVEQAKNGNEIRVFGNGERLQNYIHVSDAAEIFMKAFLHDKNEVYLGVFPLSTSNLEIAKKAELLSGTCIKFEGIDGSSSFIYDGSKTYSNLGFIPTRSVIENLGELFV